MWYLGDHPVSEIGWNPARSLRAAGKQVRVDDDGCLIVQSPQPQGIGCPYPGNVEGLMDLQTEVNRLQGMAPFWFINSESNRTGCSSIPYPQPGWRRIQPPFLPPTPAPPPEPPKSDFQRLHNDAFHALLDAFRAIAK